jgi:hypothetical protein
MRHVLVTHVLVTHVLVTQDLPSAHPASRIDLLLEVTKRCLDGQLDAGFDAGGRFDRALKVRWSVSGAADSVGGDGEGGGALERDRGGADVRGGGDVRAEEPTMVPTTTVPTSTSGGSRWGKRLAMVVALAAALVASLQANGLTDGTVPLLHLSAAHGLRTSEVPDLTGVRALVTGASSGLGLGVSRLLVAKHASVLITARTEAKCKATLEALRAHAGPRADVQCVVVELLSLRDVVRAADEIAALVDSLDWLVLDAGITPSPYTPKP